MAEHSPEDPRTAHTLADPPPTSDGSSASNEDSDAAAAATGEGSGSQIGPYRLLQLIGEGGFGSVFLAEQQAPVVRTVAFKIIKLGMDTRQVIARFAAERQALAVMDHPNIARIFDAGTTAAGRPYFVMELCKGDPISTYCDRQGLTISDRLELFEQVCQAVQHAHTKGIIHRDLKPSNILVSSQEGRPFAKVIDFGIAKATDGRLAERTMFTEHRQLIGTVEYMSPEQAEGSVDIDTRTDVYSLGVLLYELLTGSTPFSSKELRSAAHGEMQRIIREVDPPRPSDRLSRSGDTLASVAASRQVQPRRLGSLVRGELDWIVMKAMEKDRPRRYESASGLAADVRRHLDGEAVLAAPPRTAYRLGKVIRRNKGAVAAAAAVAGALMIGLVAFAWQAQVARGQRDRAVAAEAETKRRSNELQLVSDFQGRMLRQIDANAAGERLWDDLRQRFAKELEAAGVPQAEREAQLAVFERDLSRINATDAAAAMIDRTILAPSIQAIESEFRGQPVLSATLRFSIAEIDQRLGLNAQALELATDAAESFEHALGEDDARTITAGLLQADLLQDAGRLDESATLLRALLERSIRVHGPEHAETLAAMGNLGNVLRQQNKFAEAEPLLRRTLEGRRRMQGDSDRGTLAALNTYGTLLIAQGKVAETEPYWREAYETGRRALGADDPDVLIWTANMGGLLSELARWEDAAGRYREASEGFRRVRGEEHPYTLGCMKGLGAALNRMGRLDEAERVFVEVLAAQRRTLGEEDRNTLDTLAKIGVLLRDQGKLEESAQALGESLAASRRVRGNEDLATLNGMGLLAGTLSVQDKFDESNALHEEQLATLERVFGKDHFVYLAAAKAYGDSLLAQGRPADAEPHIRWAAEARLRVNGRNHPDTGSAFLTLGALLKAQGKLPEAEQAMREGLEIFRAKMNKDNRETFFAMNDLASVLVAQGQAEGQTQGQVQGQVQDKLDEAHALIVEALAGMERVGPPDGAGATVVRLTRGRILTAERRFAEAEAELLRCHRTFVGNRQSRPRHVVRTLEALVDLYETWSAVEPGMGHDAKAAERRGELEALGRNRGS